MATCRFEDVKVLLETDKALLVTIGNHETWIPKSVIDEDSEVWDGNKHDEGALVLAEWWCDKNGLL